MVAMSIKSFSAPAVTLARDPVEKLGILLLTLHFPLMQRTTVRPMSHFRSPAVADSATLAPPQAPPLSTSEQEVTPEVISDFSTSQGIPRVFEFSKPGSFTMETLEWSRDDANAQLSNRSPAGQQSFGYVFSGKVQMFKKGCEECTFTARQGEEFYLKDPSQWFVADSDGKAVLLHMHESKTLTHGDNELGDHYLFPGRKPPQDSSALLVGDKMKLSTVGPILEMATFYPGAQQSLHTHPTARIVVMMSGRGKLEWFESSEGKVKSMAVSKGMAFGWEPDVPHAFSVDENCDGPLEIFAFQTDSDTFNYPWPDTS
jgi:quercetin dioxygenase-like cupin family protein